MELKNGGVMKFVPNTLPLLHYSNIPGFLIKVRDFLWI